MRRQNIGSISVTHMVHCKDATLAVLFLWGLITYNGHSAPNYFLHFQWYIAEPVSCAKSTQFTTSKNCGKNKHSFNVYTSLNLSLWVENCEATSNLRGVERGKYSESRYCFWDASKCDVSQQLWEPTRLTKHIYVLPLEFALFM